MRMPFATLVVACALLCGARPLQGQARSAQSVSTSKTEPIAESIAILELGAASSWDTAGGAATFAPSIAVETTPIEHWLELEAGTAAFIRHNTEWDTDFLVKKPWDLSHGAEFMLGIGPEWVALRQNGGTTHSISGEVAGDFMFWPRPRHRYGWFLEPAWDRSFAHGHAQSVGITAGLLIGIR